MRRFAWIIVVVLVGACLIQAGVMISVTQHFFSQFDSIATNPASCDGIPNQARPQIEKRAWLKFPKSAQNVSVWAEGFQDCIIYVRFEMLPTDFTPLIQTTLVRLPLSSKYPWPPMFYYEPQEAPPGWNLNMSSFLAGEGTKSVYYQGILINKDDPNKYTVYVITYDNRN